jgi:hypothetical protein
MHFPDLSLPAALCHQSFCISRREIIPSYTCRLYEGPILDGMTAGEVPTHEIIAARIEKNTARRQ